jgi:exodeoxyribonuclease V alpha subunit
VVPVVRLTEIFRQARQSRIVTAAYAMNQGRMPDLSTSEAVADSCFVECDEPEAIQEMVVRLVRDRIPARFGFDPRFEIQVLTPMNRSVAGARNLNQVLQERSTRRMAAPRCSGSAGSSASGTALIQTENNCDGTRSTAIWSSWRNEPDRADADGQL